jgi:hypothetical protein
MQCHSQYANMQAQTDSKSAMFLEKCGITGDLGIGGAMPQGRGMLISMTMIQIT